MMMPDRAPDTVVTGSARLVVEVRRQLREPVKLVRVVPPPPERPRHKTPPPARPSEWTDFPTFTI
jgi:hypothetical protein